MPAHDDPQGGVQARSVQFGDGAVYVLVAALAIIAHLNMVAGDFVLDDHAFWVGNPLLDQAHSLAWYFRENVWFYSNFPETFSASYRPLNFATMWLLHRVGVSSATMLHLFSLVLHLLASLLLVRVIVKMLPQVGLRAAGAGGALFAVHPVHAEAVAWISAFVHPLACVFLLASYLLHESSHKSRNWLLLPLAMFLFGLAMLTNESAAGFPLFLLLHDYLRHGRSRCWAVSPYLVLLAGYALVRRSVLGEALPFMLQDAQTWLLLPSVAAEYLRSLVWPWPQYLYLSMPENWGLSPLSAMISAALVMASSMALIRFRVQRQGIVLALAWIVAALLPVVAAGMSPDAKIALRSLYLPSAGISILAAVIFHAMSSRHYRAARVVTAILLVSGIVVTPMANTLWRDDGRVYERVIRFNPGDPAGYLGMGNFLERSGKPEEAMSAYRDALERSIGEGVKSPLEQLALLHGKSGQHELSLKLFRQLAELDPNHSSAWVGIGNNLWFMGALAEAAEAYNKALTADPDNAEACFNLVMVYRQLGKPEQAQAYRECAAKIH